MRPKPPSSVVCSPGLVRRRNEIEGMGLLYKLFIFVRGK